MNTMFGRVVAAFCVAMILLLYLFTALTLAIFAGGAAVLRKVLIAKIAMILPRRCSKCMRRMFFSEDSRRCYQLRQWRRSGYVARARPILLATRCPRACRLPAAPHVAVVRRCYRSLPG